MTGGGVFADASRASGTRAVLSAGSNMGDRLAHLQSVVDELGDRLVAVSSVYVTAPWGGVEQDDFYNAAFVADDAALDEWGWLDLCHRLEERAERVRAVRWGPRSLDVDVIAVTSGPVPPGAATVGPGAAAAGAGPEVRSEHPDLLLPHPRAHERAFVLVPWVEIDPEARLGGAAVADLIAGLASDEVAGVARTDLLLQWGGG